MRSPLKHGYVDKAAVVSHGTCIEEERTVLRVQIARALMILLVGGPVFLLLRDCLSRDPLDPVLACIAVVTRWVIIDIPGKEVSMITTALSVCLTNSNESVLCYP